MKHGTGAVRRLGGGCEAHTVPVAQHVHCDAAGHVQVALAVRIDEVSVLARHKDDLHAIRVRARQGVPSDAKAPIVASLASKDKGAGLDASARPGAVPHIRPGIRLQDVLLLVGDDLHREDPWQRYSNSMLDVPAIERQRAVAAQGAERLRHCG